jgi:hypothetical protein
MKFLSRIIKIERKSSAVRAHKEGDEIKVERQDLGWFVLFEGSQESWAVGFDEPTLKVGQRVTVTVEAAA